MRGLYCLAIALFVSAGYAESNQSQYYAGKDNPLVSLGAQRVLKTINYPDWFLWPAMSKDVRQELVDSYTTRAYLISFDQSAANAPSTKWNDLGQLILDLLDAYGGDKRSLTPTPTPKQLNQTLKDQVVPALVKPREGYELDAPSANEGVAGEADYSGPNGQDIQNLDRYIAALARHYNIPTGYKRPPNRQGSARPLVDKQSGSIEGSWSVASSSNSCGTGGPSGYRIVRQSASAFAFAEGGPPITKTGPRNYAWHFRQPETSTDDGWANDMQLTLVDIDTLQIDGQAQILASQADSQPGPCILHISLRRTK